MASVKQPVTQSGGEQQVPQSRSRVTAALITTGTGPIASRVLHSLRERCDLRCVVLSEAPRRKSRWRRVREYGLWYSLQYAYSRLRGALSGTGVGRDLLQKLDIEDSTWTSPGQESEVVSLLKSQGVRLVVVCGLQFKVTPEFIESFETCVNVHPSYLPEYKGPEPVVWGLLEHAQHFGVSLHHMDPDFDTGDIVSQERVDGAGLRTVFAVEQRLARCVPRLIATLIDGAERGTVPGKPQGEGEYLSRPTLARRRKR